MRNSTQSTRVWTIVAVAVASAVSLHFMAKLCSTRDDLSNLLLCVWIGDGNWHNGKIQIVDRNLSSKKRVSLERQQGRVVAHCRHQAVAHGGAVRKAHFDLCTRTRRRGYDKTGSDRCAWMKEMWKERRWMRWIIRRQEPRESKNDLRVSQTLPCSSQKPWK